MDLKDLVWSELFADEELETEFDRANRDMPPWFGFPPRVLAVAARRPFQPAFALWREGIVIAAGMFGVDRRRVPSRVGSWLTLAEAFADLCRERNLFGAHFIMSADGEDATATGISALLVREADWCGMFVGEPRPAGRGSPIAAARSLARVYAAALVEGSTVAATPVARALGLRPRPDTRPGTLAPAAR